MQKILAGGTIALIESFIICPLERLKVDFITDNNYQQRTLV